jgi:hypothetical protein
MGAAHSRDCCCLQVNDQTAKSIARSHCTRSIPVYPSIQSTGNHKPGDQQQQQWQQQQQQTTAAPLAPPSIQLPHQPPARQLHLDLLGPREPPRQRQIPKAAAKPSAKPTSKLGLPHPLPLPPASEMRPVKCNLNRWTEEEDEVVRQLVAEHGERNWALCEKRMWGSGRKAKQIRERWLQHLAPEAYKVRVWGPGT